MNLLFSDLNSSRQVLTSAKPQELSYPCGLALFCYVLPTLGSSPTLVLTLGIHGLPFQCSYPECIAGDPTPPVSSDFHLTSMGSLSSAATQNALQGIPVLPCLPIFTQNKEGPSGRLPHWLISQCCTHLTGLCLDMFPKPQPTV